MDLVSEMLLTKLQTEHNESIRSARICPPMRTCFRRLPLVHSSRHAWNADRVVNRFWIYPRELRRVKQYRFDLFHIVDHSYAHLVHELPGERAVVTCHDLDAFRCVLKGLRDRRSLPFRRMAVRQLTGLRKAARVVCDSAFIRRELIRHELVEPWRTSVVPLGVHPACSAEPDPVSDREAIRLIWGSGAGANLLHVGSTIPRKRIDVLINVLAEVGRQIPGIRLVRVGGPFTAEQHKQIEDLGVADSIVSLPFLDRRVLASVYRLSALVLQPSEAEGFGLPVAEALACGVPVIASDLEVLREVGGDSASYCPVGDVPAWSNTIVEMLRQRRECPELVRARRHEGLIRASQFTWGAYARRMAELYRELLDSSTSSYYD